MNKVKSAPYMGKKAKHETTNYPMDSHKEFCRRCMRHNKGCPITANGLPTASCEL